MTTEAARQVIEFLKSNLTIEIKKERPFDSNDNEIEVNLKIGKEVISTDYLTIKNQFEL